VILALGSGYAIDDMSKIKAGFSLKPELCLHAPLQNAAQSCLGCFFLFSLAGGSPSAHAGGSAPRRPRGGQVKSVCTHCEFYRRFAATHSVSRNLNFPCPIGRSPLWSVAERRTPAANGVSKSTKTKAIMTTVKAQFDTHCTACSGIGRFSL